MKVRKNKIDYTVLSEIEIWKLVKSGKISRFPVNFWDKDTFKEIFRYICLKVYSFSREDICRLKLKKFLREECLITGIDIFERSMYNLINYCFPELNIKQWELILVPKNFWNDETIRQAINWLCEKENIVTRDDVKNKFSTNLLKENCLRTLANRYNMQYLLDLCFPELDIKIWEINKVSIWTDELAHEAIKWFLKKEKLRTREEICKRFSGYLLEKNGLGGMLQRKFDYSSIKVLEFEFPGEYKKEDLEAYKNYV